VASASSDEPRVDWRAQLAELGLRPSKALGQNFLHDLGVVRRIVELAAPKPDATVLEIGPGLGVMTRLLAERVQRVVAVELDPRLAVRLRETLPANVEVVEADALTINPAALAGPDYSVVANLPYSVATAILRRLQEAEPPPHELTIMVQREVAERIAAAPPHMSLLSVATQFYGAPQVVLRVGGGAFIPPPNVESAVLRIVSHDPPLPRAEQRAFFRVVAAGFAQRRKQLVNTLSGGLRLERGVVAAALQHAGVAPTERAERLTVADWTRVYRALAERL
jgi:16S rRNA (adenine1518-N6/adenine1519-N6)-dimethyltransferase